ncbi:MAG: hypothetical protein WBR18_08005 [Anaerolineales bacterium]
MHQIGTAFYLGWGGLHLLAAFRVHQQGQILPAGPVQGRIFQAAWNLAFFAIAVLVVAVALNWRNSLPGYWLNLTVASVTDIGFIAFILAPGYVPKWSGSLGPLLWLLAVLFSTLGIMGIAV